MDEYGRAKSVAEQVSDAMKREGELRADNIRERRFGVGYSKMKEREIAQKIFVPGKVYNYIVSIEDFPISRDDFKALRKDIRVTHGRYTIQYIPAGNPKRNPKFPYLIGQDLVRIRVTVSGPQHWDGLCDRIPELAWVRRNSTMTNAYFAIAKKHPGLVLRFGIDFEKYCAKIEKKAEELGIDIDHKPLVVWQWGESSVPEVEQSGTIPFLNKKDYASVLEEEAERFADGDADDI